MDATTVEDIDMDALAAHLATLPAQAGAFDTVDVTRLSSAGLSDYLAGVQRRRNHDDALFVLICGERDSRWDPEDRLDATADDFARATRLSLGRVKHLLEQCGMLVRDLPATLQALWDGLISLEQALAMADKTRVLTLQDAQTVEAATLPLLPGLSLADSKAEISRATLRVDPEAAVKRRERAMRLRGVTLRPGDDGMASVALTTSAEVAAAVDARLSADAKALLKANPGDERALNAVRADLMAERILRPDTPTTNTAPTDADTGGTDADTASGASADTTTAPDTAAAAGDAPTTTGTGCACGRAGAAFVRPQIGREAVIFLSFNTLVALSEEPGIVERVGPVDAAYAREMALGEHSRLRLVFVDEHGVPLAADANTYAPRQFMRRLICFIYPTCVYPGCTVPSHECDLDHWIPFHLGGRTTLENLAPLCRRHHRMKGHKGVTIERIGYTLIWTLQDGSVHTVEPHRYFLPIRC